LNLPNIDINYIDAEIIKSKPRMPFIKKSSKSKNSHPPGSKGLQGSGAFHGGEQSASEI